MNPIMPYIISTIIWLCAIYVFGNTMIKTRDQIKKVIQENKINFDFGLAPESEVIEKFGEEMGRIILEERRIVFWHFGWLWALIGAALMVIVLRIIYAVWG